MSRQRSFLQQIARDSHQLSKYAGDASAYQRGGAPMLIRRLTRRRATRAAFSIFRNGTQR